jgi:hypothetical protein
MQTGTVVSSESGADVNIKRYTAKRKTGGGITPTST